MYPGAAALARFARVSPCPLIDVRLEGHPVLHETQQVLQRARDGCDHVLESVPEEGRRGSGRHRLDRPRLEETHGRVGFAGLRADPGELEPASLQVEGGIAEEHRLILSAKALPASAARCPPAEKPQRQTLDGSTCHSPARSRTISIAVITSPSSRSPVSRGSWRTCRTRARRRRSPGR